MITIRRLVSIWVAMAALLAIAVGAIFVSGAAAQSSVDYDTDDDGLIEVSSLSRLDAIRYDLDANGAADNSADSSTYAAAFPNAKTGMGCNEDETNAQNQVCIGYELHGELDFDTNGNDTADAGDTYWNSGQGWTPIGPTYTGDFNGNGKTLSNLFIKRTTLGSAGLFDGVHNGDFSNLSFEGADVSAISTGGPVRVGVVAAIFDSGTLSHTHSEDGSASAYLAGGLIGQANRSTVEFSSSAGDVVATGIAGGLVGYSHQTELKGNYATGAVQVSGTGGEAGGLVGLADSTTIEASYATATVTGGGQDSLPGGLVGSLRGASTLKNSYATGDVLGNGAGSSPAGLVSKVGLTTESNSQLSTIADSYATGAVTVDTNLNSNTPSGLVGSLDNGAVTTSYWDSTTSGVTTGPSGSGDPKTTTELESPVGATGIYAGWTASAWDFGGACNYPRLKVDFHGDGVATVAEFGEQDMDNCSPTVDNGIGNQLLVNKANHTISVPLEAPGKEAFWDSDDDMLTYTATSSATGIATVSVTGSDLTLTPVAVGSATVTVTAASDPETGNTPASVTFTVTVEANSTPSFGSKTIDNQSYHQHSQIAALQLPTATGGNGTLTYSLEGTLPAGLSFDSAAKTITGTPTADQNAVSYTYKVADADDEMASLSFTIVVARDLQPSFDSQTVANQSYDQGIAISALTLPMATGGDETLTYTLQPDLPTGLTFNALQGSTPTISGTPSVAQSTVTYTYKVTDTDGDAATLTFTITVAPDTAPTFGSQTVANQIYGRQFLIETLQLPAATGGNGALTYSLDGSLPLGLTFDGAARTIAGTPQAIHSAATYTYKATDADDDVASLTFTIAVELRQDYDVDNNGLIEVSNLAQLNAIRWDLNGDGVVSADDSSSYAAAFPNSLSGMGCPSDGCVGYEQHADLDFDTNADGRTDVAGDDYWNDGKGWEPIGEHLSYTTATEFHATFNGNGNVISNLFINSDGHDNGLFGWTDRTSEIKNVRLENVNVTGKATTGGLVGGHEGKVSASYVTGKVFGTSLVGGLLGAASFGATVETSYSTARVHGTLQVGGLVGHHNSSIPLKNSYATGTVTGTNKVGGLIGERVHKESSYSYSTGQVSGSQNTGGLVGSRGTDTPSESYWDTTTSGLSKSASGIGKTTSQLQGPTSNTGIYSGWDADVWDFGSGVNYPAIKVDINGDGNVSWEEFGPQRGDYDQDDDGLIEVGDLGQLNAIRWDLDGNGQSDSNSNISRYSAAFPNPLGNMGCNEDEMGPMHRVCVGYELTADLDFDTNGNGRDDSGDDYWNGGEGWEPIGTHHENLATEFNSIFEGNDHVIRNLFIDSPDSDYLGLFGATGTAGDIKNVGVVDANVNGADGDHAVGGLVGYHNGKAVGVHVTGTIAGGLFVGGIVGSNQGLVGEAYANVKATAEFRAGGVVGDNNGGSIRGSYASGTVLATHRNGGGIAGKNGGSIEGSYATVNVSGKEHIGGLAGTNAKDISDSYATGSVAGEEHVGGLVGFNDSGATWAGTIARSYATGPVTGTANVGGLVGSRRENGTATDSYWNTYTSGQSASANGLGKTTAELQTPTSNTGIYASWGNAKWDFGSNVRYPALKADINGDGVATSAEFGTQVLDYDTDGDGLLEVSNLAQLNAVRWDLNGDGVVADGDAANYGHAFANAASGMGCPSGGCDGYELTADLDFDTNGDGKTDISGDEYWNAGAGWEPIGKHNAQQDTEFNAVFEGNGHTISNLFIWRATGNHFGLFGVTDESSVIRNVELASVDVSSSIQYNFGGALVGINNGTISSVRVTGSMHGHDHVGGLVGFNRGAITASHSTASVRGHDNVGGLAGVSDGTIKTSHATGSVLGDKNVGGLVGMSSGTISSSHATGSVHGYQIVGGLAGFSERNTNLSYATGSVSGNFDVGGLTGINNHTISASYASGTVNGEKKVGGLVGSNLNTVSGSYATGAVTGDYSVGGLAGVNADTIRTSYATGQVAGNSGVGGLVGWRDQTATVSDSYWDTETTGVSTSAGGAGKATNELQSPTSTTGIYAAWSSDVWDVGASIQYPALKSDLNGDGYATPWEMGSQRPADRFAHKPVHVDGNAAHNIWREGLSLRFRKADGDAGLLVDGVGYRIAQKGEACHEWFGGSVVMLGDTYGRATLTEDNGVYTLVLDRRDTWGFRPHGRICVDIGFINSDGEGGPSRRWHDIHMPAGESPKSKPIKVGDAIVSEGSVALEFRTNPYDWVKRVGYRIAKTGDVCQGWTGGRGPLWPGDAVGEASLDKSGDIWTLNLRTGADQTMQPNRQYCVDVWTVNNVGVAPTGRRWQFVTGN